MALSKRHTRNFKRDECGHCKLANRKALKEGTPACKIWHKTGHYPEVRNGHCSGRKDDRGKRGDNGNGDE